MKMPQANVVNGMVSNAIRNPRVSARRAFAAFRIAMFSETKRTIAVLTPIVDKTLQNERMLTRRKKIPASSGLRSRATVISIAIALASPFTRIMPVEIPSFASRRPSEASVGPTLGINRLLRRLRIPCAGETPFDDSHGESTAISSDSLVCLVLAQAQATVGDSAFNDSVSAVGTRARPKSLIPLPLERARHESSR